MRTTSAAVKEVVEVDSTISTNLVPFIETANTIVTAHCTGFGYTEAQLELIERWLAAHFYAIRDNAARTTSEKAGPVGANYSSQVGLYFNQTTYGQQALVLDWYGGLASLQKRTEKGVKGTASISSLGSKPDNSRAQLSTI